MNKYQLLSGCTSFTISVLLFLMIFVSCRNNSKTAPIVEFQSVKDLAFTQETHIAYKISENRDDNEIRSIASDHESNVWVATAAGVFRKDCNSNDWIPGISGNDRGPAYSVAVKADGAVLLGTWNGIYQFKENQIVKQSGPKPPISVICTLKEDTYALGPFGIWQCNNGTWTEKNYKIARSVMDAVTDGNGGLWVATDAGL